MGVSDRPARTAIIPEAVEVVVEVETIPGGEAVIRPDAVVEDERGTPKADPPQSGPKLCYVCGKDHPGDCAIIPTPT